MSILMGSHLNSNCGAAVPNRGVRPQIKVPRAAGKREKT